MELPNLEFFNRELLSGVTIGQALLGFLAVIVVVSMINQVTRARMLK